jgi:two-component system OmpR family response regulator
MGGSVRTDCDIPGLAPALHARGIRIAADGIATLADCTALTDEMMAAARGHGPVILLVATLDEVAAALDAGADDAVLRTAPAHEIAARVAARLRLAAPPIGVGELMIDRVARRVTRAGRAIGLLPREYALLLHLAQHAGEAVPRQALLEAVWGLRFDPGTNVVAVHVSRLRAKLDRDFAAPMLQTEKGVGYRLAAG